MGEIDCGGEKGAAGESLSFSDDEDADSRTELGTVGRGQSGGGLLGANGAGLSFLVLDFLGGEAEGRE